MADLIAIGRKGAKKKVDAPAEALPEVASDEIHVTAAAAAQIRLKMSAENKSDGVFRVGIMGGGCSGLTYLFAVEETARDNDQRFERDGVVVVVDPKSLTYLGGTVLDWQAELGKSQFLMRNPHVKSSCSCGSSFSL